MIAGILIAALCITGFGYIKVKTDRDGMQKKIDQQFVLSYQELTLNLLNLTVEGISAAAIDRYNTQNTKHGSNLAAFYELSTFQRNQNADLDSIIGFLSQCSGYGAVFQLNMTKELYDKLKLVPTDYFSNDAILKEASEALNNSIVKP